MSARVTMEDISQRCGISKMTVSRVLAGRGKVSAATRELVLKASKALNYEVNSLARSLSSNRSGFIGIATPFQGLVGSYYFGETTRGFQDALKLSSYDYALFDTLQESFDDGEKLAKLYRQRKVDGLLIVAPHANDHFLSTLTDVGIPLVVVGENHQSPHICSVACDDVKGMTLLGRHLLELGHKRIAFVGGPADLSSAARRKHAFIQFCDAHGLEIPPPFIHPGDYTMRSGRLAGMALLSDRPRPTAIVAANDLVAYGVMESARQLNLRIPEDVSIVGFDNLPTAAERSPSLTTIHQPVYEMARTSAEFLHQALTDGEIPTGSIQMDVTLVVRESTAPPVQPSPHRSKVNPQWPPV